MCAFAAKRPLKIDKTKQKLNEGESIAERSILQYF